VDRGLLPELTILGAGLSGLSLAYHYPGKSIVFDKLDVVGGTARTEEDGGFFYDYGPHVSFTNDPYVTTLLSKSTCVFEREARPANVYRGVEFPHPVLFHLDRLPKQECYNILVDLVRASRRCDDNRRPENYEDWCEQNQGEYFARNYARAYTKKFWCTEPQDLDTKWIESRVAAPSIEQALRGALGLQIESGYYFQRYAYPQKRGFGAFSGFWEDRQEDIGVVLGREVSFIDTNSRSIGFNNGETRKYETLVSTIPIPEMSRIVVDLDNEVKEMISQLGFTSLHYVNIAIKGNWNRDASWLYVYDEDIPATRLIPFSSMSPNMAPDGHTALQIEIPYTSEFDESCIEKSISAIEKLGYIDRSNVVKISNRDLKYGYVIYDANRERLVEQILGAFKKMGIHSLGRYGTWAYLWSHQAILQGRELAEEISKNIGTTIGT
jgi:protoporphyrinogen oxidase